MIIPDPTFQTLQRSGSRIWVRDTVIAKAPLRKLFIGCVITLAWLEDGGGGGGGGGR
jgi:hypothetical protein